MKRRVLRLAAVAAACGLASACAYTDHFDGRVEQFDLVSEQARDTIILTNIVRASRAEPLAFVQLGQMTGTAANTTSLGLPSIVLGPKPAPRIGSNSTYSASAVGTLDKQWVFGANPGAAGFASNSTSVSTSANFNVTPEESQDFYKGLLLTVEPETLAYFSEQGVAQETLMLLFTEKIVKEQAGKVTVLVNDPFDPSFDTPDGFRHLVDLAIIYGISAEPQPGTKPAYLSDNSDTNSDTKGSKKNGNGNFGPSWRLCFDRAAFAPIAKPAGNSPMCGSKVKSPDPRIVSYFTQEGVPVKLKVFPRSAFGIFQYLGRLLAKGAEEPLALHSETAKGNGPLRDEQLFVIEQGKTGAGCFISTSYGGADYCVPDSAFNTKRVLGLLVQLIALNTSIRDIAITPTVQLIQ
jgi:hypothetical protein